jgi:hypothetical protein
MDTPVLDWLSRVGASAFFWSLGLFVVVNGLAAALFISRRNREMVNKWTGRLLAFDLLLIGTGVGVPLVTGMTRLAVTTFSAPFAAPSTMSEMNAVEAVELERTGR